MPEESTYTTDELLTRLRLEIKPTVWLWRLLATNAIERGSGLGSSEFITKDAGEPLYAFTLRLDEFLEELEALLFSLDPGAPLLPDRNGGDDA